MIALYLDYTIHFYLLVNITGKEIHNLNSQIWILDTVSLAFVLKKILMG